MAEKKIIKKKAEPKKPAEKKPAVKKATVKPKIEVVAKVVEPKAEKKEVKSKTSKIEVPKVEKPIKEKVVKEPKTVKKTTKKKVKKKKLKMVLVKAKRKTAIAVAKVEEGNGRITVNKKPLDVIDNKYMLALLQEPVKLADEYNTELLANVNIMVSVKGGGQMSQIVAARGCIAKGLVAFYEDVKLKEFFQKYDRTLIVDDARRKEAKKQLGRGARARWQSSKR